MDLLSDAPSGRCREATPRDPLGVVIFGASGDLAARKLLPALYSLFLAGALPERSFILGVSRTVLDDTAFRARALEGVAGAGLETRRWEAFAACLSYQPLGYDDPSGYGALGARLMALEGEHGTGARRIYYLALPPDLHGAVAAGLGQAGLARQEDGCGWRRLVVEKPFGRDLASAQAELFRALKLLEPERIDRHLVLGQYGRGPADGAAVPGYLEEPGIDPESTTPTYALLRLSVDNWRWQGVPFYPSAGRRPARLCRRVDGNASELVDSARRLEVVICKSSRRAMIFRSSRSVRASACAANSRASTSSSSQCRTGCSPRVCARICGRTG